mmetsp:Transcript_18518/g.26071  ORF Transcript_18518/g.26071 Transcript_18518/m.26071 type:complete len:441 (-) Transcript_18518:93-1415(-)
MSENGIPTRPYKMVPIHCASFVAAMMSSSPKASHLVSTTLLTARNEKISSKALFDAHNHLHLSISGGIPLLLVDGDVEDVITFAIDSNTNNHITNHANSISNTIFEKNGVTRGVDQKEKLIKDRTIYGMGLMSTQPRDFPIVDALSRKLEHMHDGNVCVVRNYGVHPWFLHEADAEFQNLNLSTSKPIQNETDEPTERNGTSDEFIASKFSWFPYLRECLQNDESACVGEIGLDSIRYDPHTRMPHTCIDRQVQAMEAQLHLAADLHRPVSIHAVGAWGRLFDVFRDVKKTRQILRKNIKRKGEVKKCKVLDRNRDIETPSHDKLEDNLPLVLPPKIYFHAFGGKAAIVDQLEAIFRDVSETYYGFAPIVNFRSPKTVDVIQKVGINRLVLESDLEDYHGVSTDLDKNVKFVASALNLSEEIVLEQTFRNSCRLYGLFKL